MIEEIEQKSSLTQQEKDRMEKNRLRAIAIKNTKADNKRNATSSFFSGAKVLCLRHEDSRAGFIVDAPKSEKVFNKTKAMPVPTIEQAYFGQDLTVCDECGKDFFTSFLMEHYEEAVCDDCKDPDKHACITKTACKEDYLLSDVDLFKRDPPLKFRALQNPHKKMYGEMKLFLSLQVERRALEVWGSEQNLEDEKEKRKLKQEMAKKKKYQKKFRELQKETRSSLYNIKKRGPHKHVFGPDVHISGDDWQKSCTICDHVEKFEKW